ncbi:hypothetical protein NDU88_001307 [Pleurodeles waltl]|uniref:Uncharacterized protein n=1 Tax=Pleurodeles waltl TaxID=8319 RepID=A0AAV7P537_PLEWA|nr:hypothetical protein NDU88_001307 [Pleurodeles waltl]
MYRVQYSKITSCVAICECGGGRACFSNGECTGFLLRQPRQEPANLVYSGVHPCDRKSQLHTGRYPAYRQVLGMWASAHVTVCRDHVVPVWETEAWTGPSLACGGPC